MRKKLRLPHVIAILLASICSLPTPAFASDTPAAPELHSAIVADGHATLSWSEVVDFGSSGLASASPYTVTVYSAASCAGPVFYTSQVGGTAVSIIGLKSGAPYSYQVEVRGASGASAVSSCVDF